MRDYLLTQITQRQHAVRDLDKQIDQIERRRLELRAEMRAYEDMLSHLPDQLEVRRISSAHPKSNGAGR